jgi:hypothetical protein
MSVAYATKDQMKVWKSTTVPDKDYPERSSDRVMLTVKDTENGPVAYLVASDGNQLIKRNIQTDNEASSKAPLKSSIPREAVQKAEKIMKPKDRAYFEDNRIVVMEVTEDEDTGIESTRTIATIPYLEQMDLFAELESVLEKAANGEKPEKVVIVDARVLKKVVEQLKAGDERVYLTIRLRGEDEPIIMTSFEGLDYMELTAAIMPIKG